METLKYFAVSILVFTFAYKLERCNCASKFQLPLSKWKVTIWNVQKNATLQAHCKSKDNDLGLHVIDVEGRYSWEFKENFLQTTLFWCNFKSKFGHAEFEVFWPENGVWLSDRCDDSNCVWVAQNKGFSLLNIPQKKLEFLHAWEPGSS